MGQDWDSCQGRKAVGMRSWTLPWVSCPQPLECCDSHVSQAMSAHQGLETAFPLWAVMVPSGPATNLPADLTFGSDLAGWGAVSGVPCLTNSFL